MKERQRRRRSYWVYFLLMVGMMGWVAYDKSRQNVEEQEMMAQKVEALTKESVNVAPVWALRDLEGKERRSVEFDGRELLVNFWSMRSEGCREEIKQLMEMKRRYGESGLEVIGILVDEGEDMGKVKAYMEGQGVDYLVLQGDAEVVKLFGKIEEVPVTYLISKEGKVVSRFDGGVSLSALEGAYLRVK